MAKRNVFSLLPSMVLAAFKETRKDLCILINILQYYSSIVLKVR